MAAKRRQNAQTSFRTDYPRNCLPKATTSWVPKGIVRFAKRGRETHENSTGGNEENREGKADEINR
jgi:hypothetical protein